MPKSTCNAEEYDLRAATCAPLRAKSCEASSVEAEEATCAVGAGEGAATAASRAKAWSDLFITPHVGPRPPRDGDYTLDHKTGLRPQRVMQSLHARGTAFSSVIASATSDNGG